MKPSPIQLLQLVFKHVRVELDEDHVPADPPNPLTTVFTFDGVPVQTEFGIGEVQPETERGPMFLMGLHVIVSNQPQPDQPQQRFAPYRVDVAAEGVVLVPKASLALGPAHDLAAVNGAAMLWSAIREQVLTLTGRMRAGPVMLPTVHFHDLRQQADATAPAASPAAPAPARKRRAKPGENAA